MRIIAVEISVKQADFELLIAANTIHWIYSNKISTFNKLYSRFFIAFYAFFHIEISFFYQLSREIGKKAIKRQLQN